MHDVTLVYTEYNHRLEVWVLGKRAANTTADRQQYTNTSKVCDDTMSMLYTHCTGVMNNKSCLWSVTCVCVESGFILFKKIVHLAVPPNGGIVIIVNTTQHVSFHIFNAKKA